MPKTKFLDEIRQERNIPEGVSDRELAEAMYDVYMEKSPDSMSKADFMSTVRDDYEWGEVPIYAAENIKSAFANAYEGAKNLDAEGVKDTAVNTAKSFHEYLRSQYGPQGEYAQQGYGELGRAGMMARDAGVGFLKGIKGASDNVGLSDLLAGDVTEAGRTFRENITERPVSTSFDGATLAIPAMKVGGAMARSGNALVRGVGEGIKFGAGVARAPAKAVTGIGKLPAKIVQPLTPTDDAFRAAKAVEFVKGKPTRLKGELLASGKQGRPGLASIEQQMGGVEAKNRISRVHKLASEELGTTHGMNPVRGAGVHIDEIAAHKAKIGAQIENVAKKVKVVKFKEADIRRVEKLASEYLKDIPDVKNVDRVVRTSQHIRLMDGEISGSTYSKWRAAIQDHAVKLKSGSPAERALQGIIHELDLAFDKAMRKQNPLWGWKKMKNLHKNRQAYRKATVHQRAMDKSKGDLGSMVEGIDPKQVRNEFVKSFKPKDFSHREFANKLPVVTKQAYDQGHVMRNMAQQLATGVAGGALGYYGLGGNGEVNPWAGAALGIGGLMGYGMLGNLVMNPAIQKWLGSHAVSRSALGPILQASDDIVPPPVTMYNQIQNMGSEPQREPDLVDRGLDWLGSLGG